MSDSTITSKGQTTIPKAVREDLRLDAGSRLIWIKKSETEYIVSAVVPLMSLQGMLKTSRERPATIEQMNEAVLAGAAEHYR